MEASQAGLSGEVQRAVENEGTIRALGVGIDPDHIPEPTDADTEGCDPGAHFMSDEHAKSFVS